MKIGDPKKAALLGAVALLILSVAVFRMLPAGAKPGTAGGAPAAPDSAAAANAGLPAALLTDAFSHPGLSSLEAAPAGSAAEGEAKKPVPKLPSLIGTANPMDYEVQRLPGVGSGPIMPPDENTGRDRQSERAPRERHTLTLKGIVRAETLLAILSVDGGAGLGMSAKSPLKGLKGVFVVAINEGSVVLRTPGGVVTVGLGKTVEI